MTELLSGERCDRPPSRRNPVRRRRLNEGNPRTRARAHPKRRRKPPARGTAPKPHHTKAGGTSKAQRRVPRAAPEEEENPSEQSEKSRARRAEREEQSEKTEKSQKTARCARYFFCAARKLVLNRLT